MNRKLALLIGNSTYGPGLPPLEKPDADIAALAKVLADPAIGGFDEVKPLFDAPSATVRLEVARFFSGRSPDDLLLLYFSGHGLRNDRGGLYLAVQDTETALLSGTAIPAAFISEEMDNCRSRRQILILDCCYSGAFEHGAKGPEANPATAFRGNGLGRFVLTASDSTQLAWEEVAATSAGGLSVFTRHLVEGLKSGEADLDGDGLISVDELYDYVYARVVEENPRQTPGKSASKQQGEIFLARNSAGPRLRPLPAELTQALEHPLATVREGAVRELERFLRGGDAGMAKAARKAVEQACDDDSRRVAKAAAEVLSTVVSEKPEPVSPVKSAPKLQPAPAPPIFSARDSSEPRDSIRSLRESDAGLAKATGKSTEAARKHDNGRATNAKAEMLAAFFPAMREQTPSQESAPQTQPVSAPERGEQNSLAPAQTPSIKDSPNTPYTSRRDLIPWAILVFAAFIIVMVIIGINNGKHEEVEEETPALTTETAILPDTSQGATTGTPNQPDTSQALLTEAKAWPLVVADSFDSAESATFSSAALNYEDKESIMTGRIASGVLLLSFTRKTPGEGHACFLAKPATTASDFYLRVDVRKSQAPQTADAGLLFRFGQDGEHYRFYRFVIGDDNYSISAYMDKWHDLRPWTPSAAIHEGQTNSLEIIAKGTDFTFFINGQTVDQVTDGTLTSGIVGLTIETRDTAPATFEFDNLELRRSPEAPTPPAGK